MFEPSLYSIIFYALGAVTVGATLWAVLTRNMVHTIILLMTAYIGTAGLFFLLGAPLLAALEVIIYAGAFMVVFLVVIMTTHGDRKEDPRERRLLRWTPAAAIALVSLLAVAALVMLDPSQATPLPTAFADSAAFGRMLFQKYPVVVEVASLLLFVGLVGGLYLGRSDEESSEKKKGAA